MDGDHDFIYDMIRNGEAILEYVVEKNRAR